MNPGERVTLSVLFHGTVVERREDGICTVRWDSGVVERLHESELGRPPDADETGYALDDPKHPTFQERAAAQWDMRPGK